MKGLTTKQKAKRYDEALDNAKVIHKTIRKDLKPIIEKFFPELKESEDEKIRKDLLGYLHTLPNHFSHNGSLVTEWVAWLEKREHSVSPLFTFEDVLTIQCAMAYAKFQDRELDVALKKLHDKVYDAYHDSKNHHIESQDGLKGEQIPANSAKTCKDEQKPADKVEPKFKVGYVIRQTDKPEYTYTIREIKDGCYICDTCDFSTDNPLLELVKKQEWSKDDEQYLLICKNALSKYQVSDKWDAGIISRWLEERLKSLRPQSTWKPSDEQIGALEHFVRSITESGFASPYDSNTKLVYSLLNDLKKLKL